MYFNFLADPNVEPKSEQEQKEFIGQILLKLIYSNEILLQKYPFR